MEITPTKLLTIVAKESTGVRVRLGETNGKPVLHLTRKDEGSETIPATRVDWNLHRWNTNSLYTPNTKQEATP